MEDYSEGRRPKEGREHGVCDKRFREVVVCSRFPPTSFTFAHKLHCVSLGPDETLGTPSWNDSKSKNRRVILYLLFGIL